MRKFFLLLGLLLAVPAHALTQWTINGTAYQVDTLIYPHMVGPGVTFGKYDLPAYPLKVSVMEVDLKNPYVQFETVLGSEKAVGCETPTSMVARNTLPGHEVIGATNGDFYMTSPPAEVGMPRCGQLRRNEVVVNPVGSASFILDDQKRPYVDRINFQAQATHAGNTFRVHTVNMLRLEYENTGGNQTFLFTNSYGPSTYACSHGKLVLIAPKGEPFAWRPNAVEQCVVEEVIDAAGAITIPQGKAYMWMQGTDVTRAEAMHVGDEVSISLRVSLASQPGLQVNFKESIGGSNHIIMRNGKYEDAWDERHPRTMIGFTADSTRMMLVVVDGRSLSSAGVTMSEAFNIFTELGCANAVNLDGGGSTCMVVNDEVVNTPSDGPIRAVGNGCILFSNAPVDDALGMLCFAPRSYTISTATQLTPEVWGYNQYGVLKDRHVEGVTYSCDPQLGSIDENNCFTASLTPTVGYIYASKDGITTKQLVTVNFSEQALRCDSVVIDRNHPYQIEVVSTSGEHVDPVDPRIIEWHSADESCCTVDVNGLVTAVADGRTYIYGKGSTFGDTLIVNVQNPKARVTSIENASIDPATWTVAQSGGKNRVVTPLDNGVKIEFDGSSSRSPYIKLSKKFDLWGIPDSLRIRFRPNGLEVKRVSVSTAVNGGTQVITEVEQLDTIAGECVMKIATSSWCNATDLSLYPLNFVYLHFLTGTPTSGEHYVLEIPGIELIYQYDEPAIKGDVNGDGAVDISDVNCCINIILGTEPAGKYNGRADINGDGSVDIADVNAIINMILG